MRSCRGWPMSHPPYLGSRDDGHGGHLSCRPGNWPRRRSPARSFPTTTRLLATEASTTFPMRKPPSPEPLAASAVAPPATRRATTTATPMTRGRRLRSALGPLRRISHWMRHSLHRHRRRRTAATAESATAEAGGARLTTGRGDAHRGCRDGAGTTGRAERLTQSPTATAEAVVVWVSDSVVDFAGRDLELLRLGLGRLLVDFELDERSEELAQECPRQGDGRALDRCDLACSEGKVRRTREPTPCASAGTGPGSSHSAGSHPSPMPTRPPAPALHPRRILRRRRQIRRRACLLRRRSHRCTFRWPTPC